MKFTLTVCVCFVLLANTVGSAQEYGLQLNSLKAEFEADASAAMAKVKAMGIRQVEMKGTHGLSFPEFIKLLAINGLSVISFETEYDKLQSFPQVVADEARSYGAKFVVCSSIPREQQSYSKEEIEKVAEQLNHAGKIIAKNGLLLCYQPTGAEFSPYRNSTLFDYLVEKLDSRFVHFEMDVFSIKQAGQDPATLLKKYPTRFVLLQLKDRKVGAQAANSSAEKDANVVLGSGDVGIKSVIEVARELGIQYYFIEDESPKADKQIPKSLAYLKALELKEQAKN